MLLNFLFHLHIENCIPCSFEISNVFVIFDTVEIFEITLRERERDFVKCDFCELIINARIS